MARNTESQQPWSPSLVQFLPDDPVVTLATERTLRGLLPRCCFFGSRLRPLGFPFRPISLLFFVASLITRNQARAQGTLLLQLTSSPPYLNAGEVLENAGDIDLDGIDDLIYRTLAPGSFDQARIVSGSSGSLIFSVDGWPGAGNFVSLAGVGDIDNDGSPDVAIGDPSEPSATPGGQVRVFAGPTGSLLLTLTATAPYDFFGSAIASVGDLDADGADDLAVGSPGFPNYGATGVVRVVSGLSGGILYSILGTASGDFFGDVLASLPDIDGDGVRDLVVGCASGNGYVRVVSGMDGATLATFTSPVPLSGLSAFARSLADAGDVDQDSVHDILVGVPYSSPSYTGHALVYSGSTFALLHSIPGPSLSSQFGRSVSGVGDLDGDGSSDFLVGAPFAEVGGYPSAGVAYVYSGSNASVLVSVPGNQPGANTGYQVRGISDINGNGTPEIAIASPFENFGGVPTAGAVRVYDLGNLPPLSPPVPFGFGCAAANGLIPQIGFTGLPNIGNAGFSIFLSQAPTGTLAVLVVGSSDAVWAPFGLTLPWNPGSAAMPGCLLFVSGDILLPILTSSSPSTPGTATLTVPIPADAALVGAVVFAQWWVSSIGFSIVPGALSSALRVTILP